MQALKGEVGFCLHHLPNPLPAKAEWSQLCVLQLCSLYEEKLKSSNRLECLAGIKTWHVCCLCE